MISKEIIQNILDAGIRAPSGENSQPWRFVVEVDTLSIYNIPERDLSLYNFAQLGSMVAHGALIENIVIAATAFGYGATVRLLPSADNQDHIANVTFVKDGDIAEDELYKYISSRTTDRTPYSPISLHDPERAALLKAADLFGNGSRLALVEDPRAKKALAEALSFGDRLLFENDNVHDFLFDHIYWTLEEAAARRSGFYIKELALTPPQEMIFKFLRKSSVLHFFNAIGFPKVAAKGNVKLYADVAALCGVIVKGNTKKDFIEGGRLMERIWLTAAKLGYSIQPVTAIIFFAQRILGNSAQDFSDEQIEGIKKSYTTIRKELGAGNDTVAMLFRIGKGKPAARQSFRMAPEVIYH